MSRSSHIARAIPYPVLEQGNSSYPKGDYSISMEIANGKIIISHDIVDAPVLEKFLEENKAIFCCQISISSICHRELKHCNNSKVQEIDWREEFHHRRFMLRPMLIAMESFQHIVSEHDGLNPLWKDGENIDIPKGAKLAVGNYHYPPKAGKNLITIIEDRKMKHGRFKVEESTESAFCFRVKVASDLSMFLQSTGRNSPHAQSIQIHIVNCCFDILKQRAYKDSEEMVSDPHLIALENMLIKKDLPSWNNNEAFNSSEVTTKLFPHSIPDNREEE